MPVCDTHRADSEGDTGGRGRDEMMALLVLGAAQLALAAAAEWDEAKLYGPGPTALPNLEGTWAGADGEAFALRADPQRPLNTTFLRECAGGAPCGSCRQQAVHDYDTRELQRISLDCGAAGTGTVQSESSVVMADGQRWERRDTALPQKYVEVPHAAIGCASMSSCITGGGGCTTVPYPGSGVKQCYWVGADAAKAGCGSWAECLGFWCGAQTVPGSNSSWCWARDSTIPLTDPAWKDGTAYIKSSAEKIHTVHMVYMNHVSSFLSHLPGALLRAHGVLTTAGPFAVRRGLHRVHKRCRQHVYARLLQAGRCDCAQHAERHLIPGPVHLHDAHLAHGALFELPVSGKAHAAELRASWSLHGRDGGLAAVSERS